MQIKRIAMLSVHTSPLAPMGGKKTGGMNVYIRELAQELGSRGIQVDIFTRRSSADEPKIDNGIGDNVRVIYLQAGPLQSMSPDDIYPYLSEFTARMMAFMTLQGLRYDIVYSHYWLSGWVAQKLKEASGTPFVQMFHTLGQMKERIAGSSAATPEMRINVETEIVNWADRIVAATPAEEAQLRWLYRSDRRKIEIVPPGVNVSRFYPQNALEIRQQLGFEHDCNLLLFVGRIERLKAVDTLIEAIHIARTESSEIAQNLCCAIIGGDPSDQLDQEMVRLQKLVKKLELDDIVKFLGAKDQTQLPVYYAAASAVVMPSDYESFGMVALEAMASGTPVIASQVGGLAFLVRDGETGYLVPVRDPRLLAERIIWLLNDKSKSQQMGYSAAERAQGYAWEKIADRLLAIFESVKQQKRSAAV